MVLNLKEGSSMNSAIMMKRQKYASTITKKDYLGRIETILDYFYSHHKHVGNHKTHTRLPQFILPNQCIVTGLDDRPGIKLHAEHIVPLAYIRKVIFEEIEKRGKAARKDLQVFLVRSLQVMMVERDLAKALDKTKLKTEMPENWDYKMGCVYERINTMYEALNIKELYYFNEPLWLSS